MTPQEAMEELRNGAANGQLDPRLVDCFIALLVREDPLKYTRAAQEADFETELEFERRVREMAAPRATGPGPHLAGAQAAPSDGHSAVRAPS
jgi:hypothetical protein